MQYQGIESSYENAEDDLKTADEEEAQEILSTLVTDRLLLSEYGSQPCTQTPSGAPPTTAPYQFENNTGTGVCCGNAGDYNY